MRWLQGRGNRRRMERQLDEELRFDFDQRVAHRVQAGMGEEEARRLARLEFGGMEQVKEECRDARSFHVFATLLQDLKYAARQIRRASGFAAVAVLTLAVAIGINAAVFTIANAVLFKGFHSVERNDRILYISSRGYGCCVSYPDYVDWRTLARSFSGLGIVHGFQIVLSDAAGPAEHFDATEISANTFSLVGVKPMIGRDFTPLDERSGAPRVAILTYSLWQNRYAGDPKITSRFLRINGSAYRIVGVMPAGFSFPENQAVWMPIVRTPALDMRQARNFWFAFGRLNDSATIRGARAEMAAIGTRLAADYPRTDKDQPPVVQTFAEFFIGRNAAALYGCMWGAVCCLLLIACANLANLMLARDAGRSREMFVRIALGAGKWRIVRQLLIESLLLSGMGAFLGWWIALAGVNGYRLTTAHANPWLVVDYSIDYRVLAYLAAVAVSAAILFGLAPALRLARIDVNSILKDGGRGVSGARRGGLSSLLVAAEMALAVVLLTAGGVMIRSFLNVYNADLGIATANILAADFTLPSAAYEGPAARISFFERLRKRLESTPGVVSVAFAETLPTRGAGSFPFELDGQRGSGLWALPISSDYFRTMGTAVVGGREFSPSDTSAAGAVAIVNQSFIARYWPGENAVGKRVRLFRDKQFGRWMTVVGIAPNIAQNGVTRREDPLLYLPYTQDTARDLWVLVRTAVPPAGLTAAFRRAIKDLDPDLAGFGPFALTERLSTWNYWSSGIAGALFGVFAFTGLLLASVGIYGVVAHSVSRRTREIGVRMAIGATPREIGMMTLSQALLPMAAGLSIGLAAAFEVTPILKASLVHISPVDPLTFAAAPSVLVAVAMAACWIPARRAIRVDPLVALRHE